jgi:hypothetical protein
MKQDKAYFNRLSGIVILVVIGLFAIGYGSFMVLKSIAPEKEDSLILSPPTVIEYRTEAGSVLEPFLGQVEALSHGDISDDAGSALAELAARTQERLLRMRVPSSERDAHLTFVILLDQWQIAADSGGDIVPVLQRTNEAVESYRWVKPDFQL